MPRIAWDQAAFDSMYLRYDPAQGIRVPSYKRDASWLASMARTWAQLVESFNIQTTDRVLIAGAAYGWTIEAAHDAGFPNVWGIDSSSYIQANAPTHSRGDVLMVRDDFTGGGRVRAALRSLTGDDVFQWVISESVLESYNDNEIPALLNAAESVKATGVGLDHCVHMVHCLDETVDPPGRNQDPVFNWKTLAAWNALRPSHSWVRVNNGWEVL